MAPKPILRLCALAGVLLLACSTALAQEAEPPPQLVPLAKFMDRSEPVELRGARAEYSFSIPASRRVRIHSAQLHLEWTNSISLLPDRSQLRVLLNDQVLAQTALDPKKPEAFLDVQIPAPLVRRGYNQLRLQAAQHYTLECEDPNAPELWTQINPSTSHLALSTSLLPQEPQLADLPDLFDPKLSGPQRVHVVLPALAKATDAHLRWGALAAQGAALRYQFAPLEVTCSAELDPAVDNLVVGTREEIGALLAAEDAARIRNACLGVRPLPGNPARVLVAISGTTPEEVSRAAVTFTHLTFPFPDEPFTLIGDLRLPEIDFRPKDQLQPASVYRFADLGFTTTTARGMRAGTIRMELAFPPDLYAHEDTTVDFLLHFAHGSNLRGDSQLNVFLNGKYETAIGFSTPGAGVLRNYRLRLPLRSFVGGKNTVEFAPVLVPIHTNKCELIQEENLLFTLYDDSRVVVPAASRYVELPDLRLATHAAFPLLARADGAELAVRVAGQERETIAAAWTLLARLAQATGVPTTAAEVTFGNAGADRHLLAVGAMKQIPTELWQAAPLQLGDQNRVRRLLRGAPLPREQENTWRYRLRAWLGTPEPSVPADRDPVVATVAQTGSVRDRGLAMQFESPARRGRLAWMITADTSANLQQRVAEMVQPEFWHSFRGDVALWNEEPESLASYKLGQSFHLGKVSPMVGMQYYFSRYPWLWLVTVLLALLIFAWLTRLLLGRFKRRHHGDSPEVQTRS
jgi:cellulose synthase operon protein B